MIGALTLLERVTRLAQEKVRRFVVPVYGQTTYGFTAIGSGVLVDVYGRHILLTAAHVIDENEHTALHFWGGPTQKFIPIHGEVAATENSGKTRREDRRDVAVVTLASDTVHELQESDTGFADPAVLTNEPQRGGLCAIAGYPIAANEPPNETSRANGDNVVHRVLHIFFVAEAAARDYRRVHAKPETHFVASFDLERASPLPLSREGAPPSPIGLSGGGVFSFGSLRDLIDGRDTVALLGIGIEYIAKKKLVVAASDKVVASGLLRIFDRRPL